MSSDTSHPCGGCGEAIQDSPRWLCTTCSARWDAAIEAQYRPHQAADRAEDASIAAYRART